MRTAAILGNFIIAIYLSVLAVTDLLGGNPGSNVIPVVLVGTVVITRVLTASPRQTPCEFLEPKGQTKV